jgi:hypothetical protein
MPNFIDYHTTMQLSTSSTAQRPVSHELTIYVMYEQHVLQTVLRTVSQERSTGTYRLLHKGNSFYSSCHHCSQKVQFSLQLSRTVQQIPEELSLLLRFWITVLARIQCAIQIQAVC